MRSVVGDGTSPSAHGPGWLLIEQPEKPGSWKNCQPSMSASVRTEMSYVPACATGEAAPTRASAAASAPRRRRRGDTGGSFREALGEAIRIVVRIPVTTLGAGGRRSAAELSRGP